MLAHSVEHLDEYLFGINVTTHQKSDLDIYLDLDHEDADTLHDVNLKYDVLGWWKNNGHRHPVLCEMVRDIFGVLISIVPSESAFSTSGRVLDSFRSSLSPSIVEALIFSIDWFRSVNASFQDAADLEDLTELEDVALACVVAIDNGEDAEVNQPITEEGNEDSANDEDDWDDFIPCSDDDIQS